MLPNEKELKQIVEMRKEGFTNKEIAARFGINYVTVRSICLKAGLPGLLRQGIYSGCLKGFKYKWTPPQPPNCE